jgi:error-prone DNA polymerase
MVGNMVARGYDSDFAERCFKQIEGFGTYGFPESHAAAFAQLVYVSAWIKLYHPAAFAAALLNAQPMGFYAPAEIVRDAREHGVEVRHVDVSHSEWHNTLERSDDGALALRLGYRQIDGFREEWSCFDKLSMRNIAAAVEKPPHPELVERRTAYVQPSSKTFPTPHPRLPYANKIFHTLSRSLPKRALMLLAEADAFRSLRMDRREALWTVRRLSDDKPLPLFAARRTSELADETNAPLPVMPLSEHVLADYQTLRLSLKGYPLQFLREIFDAERVMRCAEITAGRDGQWARCAGVVLVRQRPGEGNAIFITLSDETGICNVVLWARTFEHFRKEVMGSRLLLVEGRIQKSPEGVVHLMAERLVDRTGELDRLSEDKICLPLSPADGPTHGEAPDTRPRHSHPRNVRVLPKSRDFH